MLTPYCSGLAVGVRLKNSRLISWLIAASAAARKSNGVVAAALTAAVWAAAEEANGTGEAAVMTAAGFGTGASATRRNAAEMFDTAVVADTAGTAGTATAAGTAAAVDATAATVAAGGAGAGAGTSAEAGSGTEFLACGVEALAAVARPLPMAADRCRPLGSRAEIPACCGSAVLGAAFRLGAVCDGRGSGEGESVSSAEAIPGLAATARPNPIANAAALRRAPRAAGSMTLPFDNPTARVGYGCIQ